MSGGHRPHELGTSDNDDVGLPSFSSRDWVATTAGLAQRRPDVAVVGAPMDINTTWRPGARFGPRAVRASAYDPGTYHLDLGLDIFEWLDVVDAGDAYCPHGQSARSHRNIEAKVTDVLRADAFPVIIGGDHSITYPAATAGRPQVRLGQGRPAALRRARRHRRQHRGAPALARHPDAPADRVGRDPRPQLRPGGSARLLAAAGGLRLDARAGDDLASDARRVGSGHARSSRTRSPRAGDGDWLYLSVDIDVLDPGFAPGTGTPEPGGMNPADLLRAVRQIALETPLVAMDVVEVSPPYDHADNTVNNAHRVILETPALATQEEAGAGAAGHPTRRRPDPARLR